MIAHRLTTIKNADKIIVFNNGNIVESGNHDELISKDSYYKKLYNIQSDKNDE
jgi:ABC-type multidrug transport system fused ATPase/permease subunit